MKTRVYHSKLRMEHAGIALACASTILVSACGGGGDGPTATPAPAPVVNTPAPAPVVNTPAPTVLTGVVATGAALANATITISDADATTADITKANATGADGSYSIDVSSLKPPYLVSASGVLNGENVKLVAVVPSVTANADNTANVTPITKAIATLLAPGGDTAALSSAAALASAATAAKVGDATTLLVKTLTSDPEITAALGANFNPLTTAFKANGLGIDSVLDKLDIVSSSSGVSITNLTAAVTAAGVAPAAVVLTAAQIATPNTAPNLPPSAASSSLPTAAQMKALAQKYEDCLALPVAQRVTTNAAGAVTAVSATCDYAPANWKSVGRNWAQDIGQFTFTRSNLTGSKAGQPIVATVFAPIADSVRGYVHPYCATATCVAMQIPMTSASGKPWSSTWFIGKDAAGNWTYVGNQLPYRIGVEQRLNRYKAQNTAGATANPTSHFFQDRFEAQLRFTFDPSVGDTNDIRAVRWKGPGLPTAGVVMMRSQRCGTDDRFGITNQEGLLTVNNSTSAQFWTTSSSVDFKLSMAKLDGTTIAQPSVTTDWATQANPINTDFAVNTFTGSIPAWSTYTAEIFYFNNAANATPTETIQVRTASAYEPASEGKNKVWADLTATSIAQYLTPTGSSAGAITAANITPTWTNPAGTYVQSGYLFSTNRISASNAANETANYHKRGRIDFRLAAFGDTSVSETEFADQRSSVSLSTFTENLGSNPNPRCTPNELVALDGVSTNSSYRELGLQTRDPSTRKLYSSIFYWTN